MNKKSAPIAKSIIDAAKDLRLKGTGEDDVPFVVVESDTK